MRGQYSVKSDVFSFGVLVLETVTGRKNTGFTNSEQCVDLLSLVSDSVLLLLLLLMEACIHRTTIFFMI